MQFIPGTWAMFSVDGDSDGRADPFDLDDVSVAAARYLCAAGGDLRTAAGRRDAVYTYNRSEEYVLLVLDLAAEYARGARVDDLPAPDRTPRPLPPAKPTLPPATVGPPPAASRPGRRPAGRARPPRLRRPRRRQPRRRRAPRRPPAPGDDAAGDDYAGPEPDVHPRADADSDPDRHPHRDSDPDSDAEPHADADGHADRDTDTDADPAAHLPLVTLRR